MDGQQIGTYRIERTLGEGGMGVVYVGVDTRLGRRAAIKQLLPALSGQRDLVERFFNEAKAAANINHPGIVEIYDVGWHVDGSAYFAMKLLDGDSLARRLRAGPLPVGVACTVARQIASAFAAAHAVGIVHRDLKPDNVMLVRDDEVAIGERAIVLDFGIAKLTGEQALSHKTRTGSVMGTPAYMSPEQCRGAGEVDHRADVYAVGCLLFEMLTGRPPFVGAGAGEVLGMHQFVEPPTVRWLRGDVPPEVEALVMRCLAKQPEQRFQRMADLVTALQTAGRTGSIERAGPPAPPGSLPASPLGSPATALLPQGTRFARRGHVAAAWPSPRRRGLVLALLGGGVVAAAAVAITVVVSSNGPGAPADETAVDPSGDQRAWLDSATRAMADRRWRDALDLSQRALDRNPSDTAATQLATRARSELASEVIYKQLEQRVADGQLAAALAAYDKIGDDSVYRASARQAIDKARQGFVAVTRSHAQQLAAEHRCADLQQLASEASAVLPEAKAAADVPCAEVAKRADLHKPVRPKQRPEVKRADPGRARESSWNDDSPFIPVPTPRRNE